MYVAFTDIGAVRPMYAEQINKFLKKIQKNLERKIIFMRLQLIEIETLKTFGFIDFPSICLIIFGLPVMISVFRFNLGSEF